MITDRGVVDNRLRPEMLQELAGPAKQFMPRVSETVFVNGVLDLICRPFDPTNLVSYAKYVADIMDPLVVVADNDPNTVLFTVPPLLPTPNTTIAQSERGGMSASAFLDYAAKEAERGADKNQLLDNFLKKSVRLPDIYTRVVRPLIEIAGRYNRTVIIDTPEGPHELSWAALNGNVTPQTLNKVDDDPYSDDMVL